MNQSFRRVIVIGTSCCGKSTFSKQLARALKCPLIELDSLYWEPNWVERQADDFRQEVESAVAVDCWVVDGNYGTVRDVIWPRATSAIWLNYAFGTVLGRAFIRTFRRSWSGEVLYSGNRESLARAFFSRDSILWWVISSFRRRRRAYQELCETNRYPQLKWLEFRNPADAERFLRSMEESS